MRLPFVSREMHVAVCSEKDRLIAALRDRIDSLERRIDKPIAVTVALPKDFAVLQPALVSRPGKRKKALDDTGDPLPAAPNIDLADLDENDERTLATVAVAKLGRRAHNAYELKQIIRGIQVEIRAAKASRRRNRQKEEQEPEIQTVELQKGIDLDDPDLDLNKVPTHILEKIAAAEGGE